MKAKSALLATIGTLGIASTAFADSLFVNMTGFASDTGFPTAGTTTVVNIGAGSVITNIHFTDFSFTANSPSWTSELAVGVSGGLVPFATPYWESQVPGSSDAPGSLGPVNAAFNNPGLYASTEGFATATGDLRVYVYELFPDGSAVPDAIVTGGGITITYTPIPAPGALALLGLAGVVGKRRRR